jgi:hypothetical protein
MQLFVDNGPAAALFRLFGRPVRLLRRCRNALGHAAWTREPVLSGYARRLHRNSDYVDQLSTYVVSVSFILITVYVSQLN